MLSKQKTSFSHRIIFMKDWPKNCLTAMGILVLLLIALFTRVVELDKIATKIAAYPYITVIITLLLLLPLSIINFYFLLKKYYLFKKDILIVFPLSFLIQLSFWTLIYGIYFVMKLNYGFIPFTPQKWDFSVIVTCFSLSLIATAGLTLIGGVTVLRQKNDYLPVSKFHKLHKQLRLQVINERIKAERSAANVTASDKDSFYDKLDECETAIHNVIAWEDIVSIRSKYVILRKDLSDVSHRLYNIMTYQYASLLRREYGYEDMYDKMVRIIELRY